MTQEQMNQILALPEAEQPRLNGVNLFQGIRPMNMFNTSMVR
jgi:hypothetical protein